MSKTLKENYITKKDENIGVVFPSSQNPSTAFSFSFVTSNKEIVVDDFIKTVSNDILYIGQIINIQTINPDSNLSKEIQTSLLKDIEFEEGANIFRGGGSEVCDLVSVSIVYTKGLNGRENTKRGPGIEDVYLANPNDVKEAFFGENPKGELIPCGVIQSGKNYIPVHLDADYVLGKQSGHMVVSGKSGMASKTSYKTFLINNIHQKGLLEKKFKVATIIFNVKDDDLLTLKESNSKSMKLTEKELEMYDILGVKPEFVGNVRNFSPANFSKITKDTFGTKGYDQTRVPTVRTNEKNISGIELKTEALFFGMNDISNQYKEVISLKDFFYEGFRFDIAGNFGQIVGLVEKKFLHLIKEFKEKKLPMVEDLSGIIKILDENLESIAGDRATPQNISKMRNYLDRFTAYYGNIVDFSGQYEFDHEKLWDGLKANDVWVIDIAEDIISSHNKTVIIKYVLNQVKKVLSNKKSRANKLDYVIIDLDEINRYIPADSDNEFKEDIIDIARAWRSKGGILIGAGQMMSELDSQFVSNVGTKIIGCSDIAESSHYYYKGFSHSMRESMSRLNVDQKILNHGGWKGGISVIITSPRPLNSIK